MSESVQTLIVGGGLAGWCAARVLSGRSTVCLATQDTSADAQASSASALAGIANPLIGRRGHPVWQADRAMAALERVVDDMGSEFVDRTPGILHPAVSSWQVDDFRRSAMERPDIATWWDARTVAERMPWLHAPRGALVIQRGFAASVPALLEAIGADAVDRGVVLRRGWRLTAWDEHDDGVTAEFDTPSGLSSLHCSRLVLALGSGFEAFDLLAALRLHSIKGQLVRVRPRTFPKGLRAVQGSGYVVPLRDGTLVVGATYEHVFDDLEPSREASMDLIERASELLPWIARAEIVEEQVGVRVTVPDTRLPMVGILPGQRHTWILTGLGSKGLLMAPMLAESLPGWFQDPGSIPQEIAIQLD